MKIKKLGALLVSVALCAGMAAPAFAYIQMKTDWRERLFQF